MPATKTKPAKTRNIAASVATVVVPQVTAKRFLGHGLPGEDVQKLAGISRMFNSKVRYTRSVR